MALSATADVVPDYPDAGLVPGDDVNGLGIACEGLIHFDPVVVATRREANVRCDPAADLVLPRHLEGLGHGLVAACSLHQQRDLLVAEVACQLRGDDAEAGVRAGDAPEVVSAGGVQVRRPAYRAEGRHLIGREEIQQRERTDRFEAAERVDLLPDPLVPQQSPLGGRQIVGDHQFDVQTQDPAARIDLADGCLRPILARRSPGRVFARQPAEESEADRLLSVVAVSGIVVGSAAPTYRGAGPSN